MLRSPVVLASFHHSTRTFPTTQSYKQAVTKPHLQEHPVLAIHRSFASEQRASGYSAVMSIDCLQRSIRKEIITLQTVQALNRKSWCLYIYTGRAYTLPLLGALNSPSLLHTSCFLLAGSGGRGGGDLTSLPCMHCCMFTLAGSH